MLIAFGLAVLVAGRIAYGSQRRVYGLLEDQLIMQLVHELGNKWGYKLRDPSEISDEAYDKAYQQMSIGGGLLLMALASCCCCSLCSSRAYTWAKQLDGPDAVATVHVKTPIKSRTRDDEEEEAGAELAGRVTTKV